MITTRYHVPCYIKLRWNIFRDNTIILYVTTFSNKKLNRLCDLMRNYFKLNTHLFFWEERFISCIFTLLMKPNNCLESHILMIYSLLKSSLRIYIETLSFFFQRYLFILKLVIDKVLLQYLEFLFFFFSIYELRAVVSIQSNVFYPSTSTSKMLYVSFFGTRFVTICLFCKFFIHYCFPEKLFDFLWLSFITVRYVFSIH